MTSAPPPKGREPHEPWEAFAAALADTINPGETINSRILESIAADRTRARAEGIALRPPGASSIAPSPLSITLPELPYLAVEPSGAHSATAASPDAPTAADFEVTGVLGEGGMGRVLLARQRSLRRDVAIKVVKTEAATRAVVDTLLAEAIVTGSIEHPSVVPVHALGRDADGRPVLVMKRIEGVSWRDLTRDPDHPAWAVLAPDDGDRLDAHLEILMAVCNAAHFAHTRGVVHRDLKPANVMIGGFGEVYLVDWGIAMRMPTPAEREAQPSADDDVPPIGTPAYMAPEMVIGDVSKIDARTDVYLLGATLHAVITGQPRHQGDSLVEVLLSARASEPFEYGPSVPAELAAICNRAMSADPDARFSSALELRKAIALFRRHRGSIAQSDQAAAKLVELDALLAARAEGEKALDERRVHRLLTECRFGFMQALSAWKHNVAAKEGLIACLSRMIEHEIEQRDLEGARDLYAELPEPRPDLAAKIEALDAAIAAARAQETRLRAMARDLDITADGRVQLALVALMPVLALGAIVLVYQHAMYARSPVTITIAPAIALVIMVTGFALVRRRVRATIGRRALRMLLLLLASITVHRLIILGYDIPTRAVFATDLLLAALWSAAMAINLLPRMAWVTALCVLGATGATIAPRWAQLILPVTLGTSMILLLIVWLKAVSQEQRGSK